MLAQHVDTAPEMCQTHASTTDGTDFTSCFRPCGQRDEPGYQWYCVRTAPQAERAAFDALRNENLCVWLPQEDYIKSNRQRIIRLLFPCYQFVQIDYEADDWRLSWAKAKQDHRLRLQLLGLGRFEPTVVPWLQMQGLLAQCGSDGIIRSADRKDKAEAGARVGKMFRVTRGGWSYFSGICSLSETERVCLLLNLFGRSMPTWVETKDVELIAG